MKFVKETLYWVTVKSKYNDVHIGVIANSINDVISIIETKYKEIFSEDFIKEISVCNTPIYRKQ